MYRQNKIKAFVAIAIAVAFIMPGAVAFANVETTMNKNISSSEVDVIPSLNLLTLDDAKSYTNNDITNNDDIENTLENSNVDWWPMFHHDPGHTGYSSSPMPDKSVLLWKYPTLGYVSSSPAVINDRLYVGSYDDNLYCLDADPSDGIDEGIEDPQGSEYDVIWKYDTDGNVYSSPAVADGKVYVGSQANDITCLNADDGTYIWSFHTSGWIEESSPTVVGDRVYIGSDDNSLYCLDADPSDGIDEGIEDPPDSEYDVIWKYTAGGDIRSSPAVVDGLVYVGSSTGDAKVYCLYAEDGTVFWEYDTHTDFVTSSPAVINDRLYIGTSWYNSKKLYCLDADPSDGIDEGIADPPGSEYDLIWEYKTGDTISSSPAVANGKVFFGSYDCNVTCLNAETGAWIWTFLTDDKVASSPAVADGKVYVGSNDKNMYCLDAENNGVCLWNYEAADTVSSSPAVANGMVYVGSRDKNVYCFGQLDHDVGVASIDSPVSGPANSVITPKVTVENLGANNELDVLVNLQIAKVATVSIDGVIDVGEWDDFLWFDETLTNTFANPVDMAVKIYMMNDADNLYIALDIPDTYDMRDHPEVAEGGSDTFSLNIGVEGEDRSWKRTLQFNTARYPDDPSKRDGWTELDGYLALWSVATSPGNVDKYGPAWEARDIPTGVQSKTIINETHRVQEIAIPLSDLDVSLGDVIRVGGCIRAAEFEGYNFHALYPEGLDWGDADTYKDFTMESEYDETVYIDINAGETKIVTFSEDWTPNDWQVSENVDISYAVTAYTYLDIDEKPGNDCVSEDVTLEYPYFHDVGLVSIDSPLTSGPAATFPVKATIENVGQFPEDCFKTHVGISQKGPSFEFLSEDFSGTPGGYKIPSDWTQEQPGMYESEWYVGTTSWAGGASPEAYLNYDFVSGGTSWLQTPSIDTSSACDLELEFKSYIWSKAYYFFDCNVLIRPDASSDWVDITPWTNPLKYNIYGTYIVDASAGIGSATEVRWLFTGGSWTLNKWYLDDVILTGGTPGKIDYTDYRVISEKLYPGEERQLTFDEWTPDDLQYAVSGTIDYIVNAYTDMVIPLDSNPDNDAKTSDLITLGYFHDIGIKEITNPSLPSPLDEWIYFHSGFDNNAVGFEGAIVWEAAIRITPDELTGYDGWELTAVKWYQYDLTSTSGNIKIYEAGTSSTPGPLITSEPYTVTETGITIVTLTTPVVLDKNEDVWVSVEMDQTVAGWPMGIDAGPAVDEKGDWIYCDGTWQEIQEVGTPPMDYNWIIEAKIEMAGAPPPVDIYLQPGTHPIASIVENIGVFYESDLTVKAEIYAYTPDATLIYESIFTDIDLIAGEEEPFAFDDWTVTEAGRYRLDVRLPLAVDDYPDNNVMTMGIGIDDVPPVSDHEITSGTVGDNNWYVSDVEVTLDAIDGTESWQSGVDVIKYKVDTGSWLKYIDPFDVTEDGEHTVYYFAIDNVENKEADNTVSFKIDQTPPEVNLTWKKTGRKVITFTSTCSDDTSLMDRVEFAMNYVVVFKDEAEPYEWTIDWSEDMELIMFTSTAYDKAGNSAFDEILGNRSVSQSHSQSQSSSSVTPIQRTVTMLVHASPKLLGLVTTPDPETELDVGRVWLRGLLFKCNHVGNVNHAMAIRLHYTELTPTERTSGMVMMNNIIFGDPAYFGYMYEVGAGLFTYVIGFFEGGLEIL